MIYKNMRIGLMMIGDYGWAGGLYYVFNIIKLFKKNESSTSAKIELIVFHNNSLPAEIFNEIKEYPITLVNLDHHSVIYKIYGKVVRAITGKNIRLINDINKQKIEALFPITFYSKDDQYFKCKVIYWLYDFQHKFYPDLFTKEEIVKRDKNFKLISEIAPSIVLSSEDSKNHFHRFYPESKALTKVFNFASLIDQKSIKSCDISKYKMPDKFFVVSNQFWKHKNHMVVLKALKILNDKGLFYAVVFTGNTHSYSSNNYFSELESFIQKNDLKRNVLFTGFIDRQEQLALMNASIAVIQPSLFEGWSTVIEDAKALNKFIIASSISINKEQVKENVCFFEAQNAVILSEAMEKIFTNEISLIPINYNEIEQKAYESMTGIFILHK